MNQKKKAINSIITSMKKSSKDIGCILEFTEDDKVVLSDSYAFLIAPVEEFSIKDKERLNKLYDKDVFNHKEVTYVVKCSEKSIKSKFLEFFLNDKFLSKDCKIELSEKHADEKFTIYQDKNGNEKKVNNCYQNLINSPKTFSEKHYELLLSNIDNLIVGVMPIRSI